MEVFEITGYQTGVSRSGVNFLQPSDSFEDIQDGYIYRQVLQSRKGIALFAPRLDDESRITGIFEFIKPDGSVDLLATDMNYLYKYNTSTAVFDQLSFGGSMAAYGGFSISNNEDYISGTAYPFADGTARFVFTGRGIAANAAGSSIFFYDVANGDVRDYTAVADNADYVAPAAGALTRATHVLWFNERINFFSPVIAGTEQTQGIIFSGIRNSGGNGDDFNVSGSGTILLDTSEDIRGASILGDRLALNLTRSNWVLEKRGDPFNPYSPRKIPSVIGTDASFSFTQWNNRVLSVGKTGILAMDGRESVRVDNKIPFFTADDMDSPDFELVYGGFDRITNQFLWSYKESEDSGDTQNKVLSLNYEFGTWSVYNLRFSVFGQTSVGTSLTWDDIEATAEHPEWATWDGTEDIWNKIGLGEEVEKTLAGDDLGFIYALNTGYDDDQENITAITQASQAVLTVDDSAFQVGDEVIVSGVSGMVEINNYDPADDTTEFTPYTVVAATATSITLNVNSTDFTAYTSDGLISRVISFEAKTVPFNPYREQGRRCFISYVEFLLNTNGGFLYVDIFMDEQTTPFKENVLIKPNNTVQQSRQWVSLAVDQDANFFTFKLRQKSPAFGVELTSMRIHANPGGLTSG